MYDKDSFDSVCIGNLFSMEIDSLFEKTIECLYIKTDYDSAFNVSLNSLTKISDPHKKRKIKVLGTLSSI